MGSDEERRHRPLDTSKQDVGPPDGLRKIVERRPQVERDFVTWCDWRPLGKRENEGANDDRRQNRVHGREIVQHANNIRIGKRDAGLFKRLASRRGQKRRIAIFAATAGKRHLARPGIALQFGTFYEQNIELRVHARGQHDRNRCFDPASQVCANRFVPREPLVQFGNRDRAHGKTALREPILAIGVRLQE